MYILKQGVKKDPNRRWRLPDRIFFGYGACHILAGVYVELLLDNGYYPVWIKPLEGLSGNHIFMTDGVNAFDYHGYSKLSRLLAHHQKGWSAHTPGWDFNLVAVDFSLLDTKQLNCRKMRGPDQFLHNPIDRAKKFLNRYSHAHNKT